MVRPDGVVVVVVVGANARNRIICAGRIAGLDIGRRRGIRSARNGPARTVVVSGKRGQHGEVAFLARQEKLALPFQQRRVAEAHIQPIKKPRGPSGDAHFRLFRFVGPRSLYLRDQHRRHCRKN